MLSRLVKMQVAITFAAAFGCAQWVPKGRLARVPVIENCRVTNGDIAVTRQQPNGEPVIYYCQAVANRINAQFPEAGRFYFVHEFAHASGILNEDAADCWAAEQLANAPNGQAILESAIAHFQSRGSEWHPGYSTASQRAANIARCAASVSAPEARQSNPPQQRNGSCEAGYRSCVSRVRSVDQCVREEFPERCIKTCVERFGYSEQECTYRRCRPTPENVAGWRSRCRSITDDERDACRSNRERCLER